MGPRTLDAQEPGERAMRLWAGKELLLAQISHAADSLFYWYQLNKKKMSH